MKRSTFKRARTDARLADAVLPHLDAAYNFARWLARNDHDAEDIVQEAYLRAVRYGHSFSGENPRAWILAIVRNTFYTWRKGNNSTDQSVSFDEELHCAGCEEDPEARLIRDADAQTVTRAIEQLPAEFREVIVLREFEDLSYREIARVTGTPIGTVMSRLARARAHLRRIIMQRTGAGA